MKENNLNISFESIVTLLPGYVYWLDRNNVFLGCNTSHAKAVGLKHWHEIIGKTNYDMPWRDQAEALNTLNNKVIATGQEHSVEEIGKLADGTERIFISKKVPLLDDKNNIVGVLGISFDITEQKKAEQELIEAKRTADIALDNIIAHLPGNVYWLDRNNVFLGCNNFQAISAGLKNRHEIVGKTNYDMPWRDQADILNVLNNKVMATGQEYSVEETAKQANGTKQYTFLSKKAPLYDNKGNIIGILGISFDITKQKEAEKQLMEAKEMAEAANNAKTEFLENMRHDIRTPLGGIIGLSELLGRESDLAKIKNYTALLADASKELLRFLNDVLESINVTSGQIPLLKKTFNLKETLENLIKLHQPKAVEKQLMLTLNIDEFIPTSLIGDPVRIYRILLELLVNALKFTKEGKVLVYTRLAKKEEQNVVIQIFIEDTGPGIPVEKQQELFVRFKQLTPSYLGIYKGAGLGLSIVKQFIDDIQGEIYVESQLNEGTKFVCIIPLKIPLLDNPFEEQSIK
jgi:two-component system aerobic respiration control sensor histidine kinase ArcB